MSHLVAAVRRATRVLWALHVTLQEGFRGEAAAHLERVLPSAMLLDLRMGSQASLLAMADAFPSHSSIRHSDLDRFRQAVHDVIEMSDNQRRAVMAALEAGAGRSAAELWAPDAAQPDIPPWSPPVPSFSARRKSSDHDGLNLGLQAPLLSGSVPRPPPAPSESKANGHAHSAFMGRLDPMKVDAFPQTSAGYALKMRWYCMQFMMVQLADELQELYDAMSQMLAKLPRPDS